MAARAGVFLIVLLLAKAVEPETRPHWVVWNVGQGLMVTRIENGECRHFDMGGERAPWARVMASCRTRRNFVWLSHWDSDHIGFVGRARYFLPNICREELPAGTTKPKKRAMVERVPVCKEPLPSFFAAWRPDLSPALSLKKSTLASNDNSSVVLGREMLLPGDSSRKMEKIWLRELRGLENVRFLALGHHGSRTSTSPNLLKALPQLRLALASARRRRYGHPHPETVELLRQFKVPVLSTEDWGNIVIW